MIVPIGNLLYSYSQRVIVRLLMTSLNWDGIIPPMSFILTKETSLRCLFCFITNKRPALRQVFYSPMLFTLSQSNLEYSLAKNHLGDMKYVTNNCLNVKIYIHTYCTSMFFLRCLLLLLIRKLRL